MKHDEMQSFLGLRTFGVALLSLASCFGACGDGADEGICESPLGTYEVTVTFRGVTALDPRYDCDPPSSLIVKQTSIFGGATDLDEPGCKTTSLSPQGDRCEFVETTQCADGSIDQLSVTVRPDGFSGLRIYTENGCRVEANVSAVRLGAP